MSDLTGPLKRAIATTLRADGAVIAAFGANSIRIVDIPTPNEVPPYLTLGPGQVLPIFAEGFDLSEAEYPVHVWSLTSPPSSDEAEAIAPAVRAALAGVTVSAGGRVYAVLPVRTDYLIDPSDGRTVHAVITSRFTTAPA